MWNCPARPDAVAYAQGGEDAPCLSGKIQFYPKSRCVLAVAHVSGLPQGSDSGFLRCIFTRSVIVLGRIFQIRAAITIQPQRHIPATQGIFPH